MRHLLETNPSREVTGCGSYRAKPASQSAGKLTEYRFKEEIAADPANAAISAIADDADDIEAQIADVLEVAKADAEAQAALAQIAEG